MRYRERLIGVAVILTLLLAVKIGRQAYSWYVFADERSRIERLSGELEEAGVEIVRTQLAADSLHALIEGMDAPLEARRVRVESYGRRAVGGALPGQVYDAYRAELEAYNRGVGERNTEFEVWREVIERNHAAVARFNAVADSIRALAAVMGEPYYPIPTPAEIAVDRGVAVPR